MGGVVIKKLIDFKLKLTLFGTGAHGDIRRATLEGAYDGEKTDCKIRRIKGEQYILIPLGELVDLEPGD